MSRSKRRKAGMSRIARLAALAALALVFCAAQARAGVIVIENDAYSLDGGRPVTGAWEIAEKLAVAKDAAVVVLGPAPSLDALGTTEPGLVRVDVL